MATETVPTRSEAETRWRILIADDNQALLEMTAEFLLLQGFECECAGDGEQAVARFRRRPAGWFDLILMDCDMPRMDGYDATRTIRQLERADRRIPILAMTARSTAAALDRCLAAGMSDLLPKPFRIAELLRMLDQLIGPRDPEVG